MSEEENKQRSEDKDKGQKAESIEQDADVSSEPVSLPADTPKSHTESINLNAGANVSNKQQQTGNKEPLQMSPSEQTSNPESLTSDIEPQSDTMEVHHHGHVHHEKKWKDYLFQFLMLFLAVFCGFLAEYKLEHVIEHNREKQYMRTVVEDLKKDTAGLEESIRFWNGMAYKIDATRPFLKPPVNHKNVEEIYELAAMLIDFNDFIYNDRTTEQLRSSGNFRLIRRLNVADSLISYDNFIRVQLKEQETTLLHFLVNLLSLQNELFDSDIVQSKFHKLKGKESTGSLQSAEYAIVNNQEKLFKYFNDLFLYRAGIMYLISSETGLKLWAENLIHLVKKEYNLK